MSAFAAGLPSTGGFLEALALDLFSPPLACSGTPEVRVRSQVGGQAARFFCGWRTTWLMIMVHV